MDRRREGRSGQWSGVSFEEEGSLEKGLGAAQHSRLAMIEMEVNETGGAKVVIVPHGLALLQSARRCSTRCVLGWKSLWRCRCC